MSQAIASGSTKISKARERRNKRQATRGDSRCNVVYRSLTSSNRTKCLAFIRSSLKAFALTGNARIYRITRLSKQEGWKGEGGISWVSCSMFSNVQKTRKRSFGVLAFAYCSSSTRIIPDSAEGSMKRNNSLKYDRRSSNLFNLIARCFRLCRLRHRRRSKLTCKVLSKYLLTSLDKLM